MAVGSWGAFNVNGVGDASQAVDLAGFPLYHTMLNKKQHIFDVVLGTNENITISTFKDLVSVKIKGGSHDHFGASVGIMGTFGGELLARNGSVVNTDQTAINAFGQDWQVREDEPMLFESVRAPQAPYEKCRLPSMASMEQRRLGEGSVTKEAAEKACAHLIGEDRKEACIFDCMAVGDIEIAQAGAY